MTTRIFLSYGRGDDDPDFYDPAKSFMRRLYNGLKAAGFDVWWDRESLPARGLTFLEEIRDAITASDKLVLVVGEYSVRPGDNYVRPEWEYALSICKTIVPILRNGDYKIMPPEIAFTNAPDFRDLALFDQKLAELIRLLSEDDAPMGNLYNVSDLPRGYIERKADMQAVSAMIRSDAVKPTVVTAVQGRAAALYGLGGIGKTILTRALCYDCDLRRSFPDGIIWLEIGKTPLTTSRQADIGEIFGDSRDKYVDEQAGKSRLAQMLYDKKVLLILDDVWEEKYVELFRVPSHNCRLLVTTRNQKLANSIGANNHELDKLSEKQGIQLIATRLNKNLDDIAEIETLKAIVNLLDGHTLAISIAAVQLEEQGLDFAPRLLERMQKRRDGDNPFKDLILEETDKNANLELSLSLSYDDLKPDLQRRFRALGILTPDGSFDTALAAAIWDDTEDNLDDTEDALNTLVQAGLLIRENSDPIPPNDTESPNFVGAHRDAPSPRYAQHNLLCAYAYALLTRVGELDTHFNRYTDSIITLCEGFITLPPEQWQGLEADSAHILYIGDTLHTRYTTNTQPDSDLENRALQFCLNIRLYLANRREISRIAWVDMGLVIVHHRGEQKSEALFMNDLGAVYNALGDKVKALDYYQQALPVFQTVNDRKGEAAVFNNIGKNYSDLGERAKALDYYQQALPMFQAVGDRKGEAAVFNNIGGVYNDLGERTKALDYYQQALPVFQAVGDRDGEAATLNNLGMIYSALGEKTKALDYYQQALSLVRMVGNRGGEAQTFSNIGAIYHALGEKTKALDYYQQALSLVRVVGDRGGEAQTLSNIGIVYHALGEKTKALDYYQQALSLVRVAGIRRGEAVTLNNIGGLYNAMGEKQKALDYYQQALLLVRAVGNQADEAVTLNNMTSIYFQEGEIERADIWGHIIIAVQSVGDVASEATYRVNHAVYLAQLNRVTEAIAEVEQSIAILKRYNLPQDAAGQTLAQHEAFLARLRGEPSPQPSFDEALAMLKKILDEQGEAALRKMLGDRGANDAQITAVLERLRSP